MFTKVLEGSASKQPITQTKHPVARSQLTVDREFFIEREGPSGRDESTFIVIFAARVVLPSAGIVVAAPWLVSEAQVEVNTFQ